MYIYKNDECNFCENIKNFEKNNKKQGKKTKFKRILIKFLLILLIFVILVFCFFNFAVNPQIINGNTAKIKSNTINIVNSAVDNSLLNGQYDNLFAIEKNASGDVVLISVNSANANILANSILLEINEALSQKNALNYSLPLGAFSGIPALSSVGPNIDIKILTIGSATAKFRSTISSLSINQSYHKIYLNIHVEVAMFLPLHTENISVTTQLLIAENLIVGKIPNTYLNTESLTNALNN